MALFVFSSFKKIKLSKICGTPDSGKGVLYLSGVIIIGHRRFPGWASGMFEVATPAASMEGKVRYAVPKGFVGWSWGAGGKG